MTEIGKRASEELMPSKEELDKKRRLIRKRLKTLRFENVKVTVVPGPVVSLYKVQHSSKYAFPSRAWTVIEYGLRFKGCKGVRLVRCGDCVGIEISNDNHSAVYLNEIVESKTFLKRMSAGGELPVAIGKDVAGKPVIFDLADEFGILISGATKQGKTVCMKTIVSSLMHGCAPSDLKIVIFNAAGEKDYAEFGPLVRPFDDVVPFLRKLRAGNPFSHILVAIDMDMESLTDNGFADIVRDLSESPDSRGIHIVLSTLRPSEIPQTLKKCFRRKMAFRMLTKEDSIGFLGKNGAAKWLKGHGDMLMKSGNLIRRVQCAIIPDGVNPCPYFDFTAYTPTIV